MPNKLTRTLLKRLKLHPPFEIPSAEWPQEKELTDILSSLLASKTPPSKEPAAPVAEVPAGYLKALVSIATNAWRAKRKMLDTATGEVREDMKRVDRHIEAIYRNLAEVGILIRDHTGDAYDEGQPMKVIASRPREGLDKKRVSETLLPSVFWNNRLLQNGEIELATPPIPDQTA